jgi:thymidine kinase
MAKLHFNYGTMNSSKSAQVLMTRFNFIQNGQRVWLIKPSIDTRDGIHIVKSRIGLQSEADVIESEDDLLQKMLALDELPEIIIADESQFFTEEQIYQLREIVSNYNIHVFCYGLRTDFKCKLFPASKALFELADEFVEIKSGCKCGKKATVNARLDSHGNVTLDGGQIEIGGNERYVAMCWTCYHNQIKRIEP